MGPDIAPPSPPPPYGPTPPPRPRRLTRSSHDRMWAGVAGGMAEYFDIDPALVRLMWVAAAVVSGGLAVPLYFLAWIILPRDDRPPVTGQQQWRDWSREFHAETQRLAEEARRVAGDVREGAQGWHDPAAAPTASTTGAPPYAAASDKGKQTAYTEPPPPEPWWQQQTEVERHRHHGRNPRSAGIVLVALGVIFLAANAGLFSFIEWRTMWPLIFIGLGVLLLARQTHWGR
jgi:phage shock protein C